MTDRLLKLTEREYEHLLEITNNVHGRVFRDQLTHGAFNVNQAEALVMFADHEAEDIIDTARDLYASDNIEIDDAPMTSRGDGGCWVSAWVWVVDEDDPVCDGCGEEVPETDNNNLCPNCAWREADDEEADDAED